MVHTEEGRDARPPVTASGRLTKIRYDGELVVFDMIGVLARRVVEPVPYNLERAIDGYLKKLRDELQVTVYEAVEKWHNSNAGSNDGNDPRQVHPADGQGNAGGSR